MDFSKLAQSPLDGLDDIALRIKKIEATLISIDNTLKQLAPVIALIWTKIQVLIKPSLLALIAIAGLVVV